MTLAGGLSILAVVVLLPLLLSLHRKRSLARAAREIRDHGRKLYSGKHEHAEVRLDQVPGLDRAFYERSAEELESRGFAVLGDVEDLTATAASPSMRTAIRVSVSPDRTTTASIYHVKLRGAIGLVLRIFGKSSIKVVELESFATDGRVVATSNASLASSMDQPPQIDVEFTPPETSVEALIERHSERMKRSEESHPEASWSRLENLYDVLRMQEYLEQLKAQFRRGRGGGVSPEEVRRVGGGGLADEVAEKMDELDSLDP